MKKIIFCVMATSLSLTFIPLQSHATITPSAPATDVTRPPLTPEANTMLLRLHEIKDMDKTNLSASERKDLRKEVRSLKHELRRTGYGVYISVGAAIIIVLLLIIIL